MSATPMPRAALPPATVLLVTTDPAASGPDLDRLGAAGFRAVAVTSAADAARAVTGVQGDDPPARPPGRAAAAEALLRRVEAVAHVSTWTYEVAAGEFITTAEGLRLTGRPPGPIPDADVDRLVHPDDLPAFRAALAGAGAGAAFERELRLVVDGRVRWVAVRGEPERDAAGRVVRVLGVTQDVTARRELEDQFRQARKLEAFGQLAGGVAHDFNNLLTVISGYTDLLLRELPPDGPARDLAAEVSHAADRAAGLTRQLLAFGRRAAGGARATDPNAVVADLAGLLRRMAGADVALATHLAPGVGAVRADPGQLGQVLTNLVLNARDAMPRGGRLTVETCDVVLGPDPARGPGGAFVLVAVSDTGVGMSPEVQARVFEPFFTTKRPGEGTGLGLATVAGIVRQAGGHVELTSAVGEGTTFRVYLPAVRAAAPTGAGEAPVVRGGGETVLLVEDQEDVRQLAQLALQTYGYAVLPAADGAAALGLAAERPVDVLVSDVVMPGMSGPEVAAAVRARNPRVGVLFTSGYADDAVLRRGGLAADAAFLPKPYTPLDLARMVRDVLDRRGAG